MSLIISVFIILMSIIINWFSNDIAYAHLLGVMALSILISISLLICLIWNVKLFIKNKKVLNMVIILLICVSFMFPFLPVQEWKIKSQIPRYKEIINQIQNSNEKETKEIELPEKYRGISVNNKIIVKKTNPLILQSYFYIGLSIDPIQVVVYIENDNEKEIKELFSNINKIKRIQENWYYVIAYEV